MGYVDSNLMSGEQVVCKANIHWFVFVPGVVLFVVGILLFGVVDGTFGAIVIFLAILFLLKAFIFRISTELAVTSKRVIAKWGLIKRNTIELNHSKVESFAIEQSILGRLFGFVTLSVNGTGGRSAPIPSIDAPLVFRRNAMETIDSSQSR
ncbi:MAG: PH domain-containing protein [Candidatus Accumulibacter sp.]|jgi:uncharacterized membrane protein YdbT with pleckstrin-like domain|nr:PH domain-containing protein [Accumulibacter sp.]